MQTTTLEAADLPHTTWTCEFCKAENSCLDGDCQFCDGEAEAPKPAFYTVAVYLDDRAYGGPEEGGWWFDCDDTPWYDFESFFMDPGLRIKVVVVEDESTGATSDHFISLKEITDGLQKLAASKDYSQHFRDIVNENDDAATADIFMQFVVFGEEVYA